ncbi:MAG: hypothetical protein ACR2PA_07480 [Hyphomicrobiaceae bacterium]
MSDEYRTIESYFVIGFVPDDDHPQNHREGGVHTPLRSDGYYGPGEGIDEAMRVREKWRRNKLDPRERIEVVKIVRHREDDEVLY